jgi:hypothetical protein
LVYGDDKAYEMARSLLPSTGRKQAREARVHISRGTRRTVRGRVAQLARDADAAEDCPDLDADSAREMRYVVWRRQAADKVNPFQRWARAITRELPRDARLKHVRGVLPEGLIGEHALSHLERDAHFESAMDQEQREAHRRMLRRRRRDLDPGLHAQLLRQLLRVPGGQRAFNDYLKHETAQRAFVRRGRGGRRTVVLHGEGPPRLLLGVHDVLPFLEAIAHRAWRQPPPESAMGRPTAGKEARDFLREFHKQRGNLAATLAALPRRVLPPAET